MARQGVGIALQGEIDQPQYLLRQAEKRRKKRQNRLANAKKEQAKIAESLQTLDKKIHPVYDPKVKDITTELKDKAQKLRTEYQEQYGDRGRYLYTKDPRYSDLVTQTKRKLNNYVNSTEQIKDYQEKLSQEGVVGYNGVGDALRQNDFNKLKEVVGNEQGYFNLTPVNQKNISKIAQNIADRAGYAQVQITQEEADNNQLNKTKVRKLREEEFNNAAANVWQSDKELRRYAATQGINDFETFREAVRSQVPTYDNELSSKNKPQDDDVDISNGAGAYFENYGFYSGMSKFYEDMKKDDAQRGVNKSNLDQWAQFGSESRLESIPEGEEENAMGTPLAYNAQGGDGKYMRLSTDEIYKRGKDSTDYEPIANPGEEQNIIVRTQDFKIVPGYVNSDGERRIARSKEEVNSNAIEPMVVTKVEPQKEENYTESAKAGYNQWEKSTSPKDESGSFALFRLGERGVSTGLDSELGLDSRNIGEETARGRRRGTTKPGQVDDFIDMSGDSEDALAPGDIEIRN